MNKLYVVATPIGNRQDLSPRAQEVFKSVDLIISEAPRASLKLLAPLGVTKKIAPLMIKAGPAKFNLRKIITTLQGSGEVALISEAGTPGINDPGGLVVEQVRLAGFEVVSVPGANAAIAAASISGFPLDQFMFLGFVPHKKGRETFFIKLKEISGTVIFYESPHRFEKTRQAVAKYLPERFIMVARELTKLHEQSWVGTGEALAELDEQTLPIRGEFVLVLAPQDYRPAARMFDDKTKRVHKITKR